MKEIKLLTKINNKSIEIPCSKSYLNRALIIASLTNNVVKLINIIEPGEDVVLMINILSKLGIKIEHNITENMLIVYGRGGKFSKPEYGILNCGIAGTTARFTVGLSTLFDFDITITGEGKMLERPIFDLINTIKQIGIEYEYLDKKDYLPVKIFREKNIKISEINIDCSKSSQFLSSLLMITPLIGLKKIEVSNLVSKSYIDITLDVMQEFGIDIVNLDYEIFQIPKTKYKREISYSIESDWSSVSYFIALEYLHEIELNMVELNYNSMQGDRGFVEILKQIKMHNNEKETLVLDMSSMPDTSMTAMIISAFQNFTIKIIGLRTLKDKECNRLQVMQNEFKKLALKLKLQKIGIR